MTRLPASAPLAHRVAHRLARSGWRRADLYWELAERLGGPPARPAIQLGPSVRLPLESDDVSEMSLYRGTYEQAELLLPQRFVPAGGNCVDVGANIGLYTVLLACLAGPEGRVIAFEPATVARRRLLANIDRLSQVTVLPDALGARAGTAVLSRWSGNAGAATLRDSGWPDPVETATVGVRRLDEVPAVVDAGEIDFLKVDVEGWESDVFAGATGLLESHRIRAALVEVNPGYGPVGYVDDLLADHAYQAFRVAARPTRSRLRRTLQLEPLPAAATGTLSSQVNVLFVRRDAASAVSDLVRRAVAS